MSIAKERCFLPTFDNFLGKIAKIMDDLEKLPRFNSSLLLSRVGSSVSSS